MRPEFDGAAVEFIRHVTVVLPAHNEAATLGRSLRSIDEALSGLPTGVTGSCVVVLDRCRDDSANVVTDSMRHLRSTPRVVSTEVGRAGAARDLGTRTALEGRQDLHTVWLANTDSDTVVPANWLRVQLDLANRGADAIAGIVQLDVDSDQRLRRAFRASYAVGRDGTHGHVHGANLGVRADVLMAVGGWRHLPTGEDHDLWSRLRPSGTCVSSTEIVVRTSGRLVGRAPRGFAADLAAIADAGLTVA